MAAGAAVAYSCGAPVRRVVFSLTTIPSRIAHIRPTVEALLAGQSQAPDVVYISVGPEVGQLPGWLEEYARTSERPALRVLRQPRDLGPGLKLLGAVREELHLGRADTLVIFGDDDVVYGSDLVRLHASQQRCSADQQHELAFGARRINAGQTPIPVLEATGSISIRAGAVPEEAFQIGDSIDACKFSDDFFFARAFRRAGVRMELLRECAMNWNTGDMSPACTKRKLEQVERLDPLSKMVVDSSGRAVDRASGDWRTQFNRYALCESKTA